MKLIRLIVITCLLFGTALNLLAQKEIFIKQIEFKLDAISDIDYENEYFVTIKMNKGSKYVFRVVNHIDDYIGEAVVELMDADNLILTNLYQDKYYLNSSFVCNKTGFYDLLVRFRDNKLGNSVIDILLVQ
ncbi:MAG: hypothetical protein JXB24_14370 [Bacteroidales bacterium]|nr:hypothetical protein [Bacteroidales bacterium]